MRFTSRRRIPSTPSTRCAAAKAGKHVLCEKPLAVTQEECRRMAKAASQNNVKLMTAYRLHFEPLFLEVLDIVRSGKIGEPRLFLVELLDARQAGRHPHAARARRRHAL